MKSQGSMRNAAASAFIAIVLLGGCGADTPEALLASAKGYLAKDEPTAAVVQLRTAVQRNPNLAEARFLLGSALLETADPLSAEKELRKALQLGYPAEQVLPQLARTVLSLAEYQKVIDEFSNAKVGSPESNADLQATIGEAQLALGQVDAARAAFAAALTAQPDYPRAMLGEAQLKASDGDLPGALALLDAAMAKAPKLVEALQFKGEILLAQGKPDMALAAYRSAVKIRPDNLLSHALIMSTLVRQAKIDEAAIELEAMKLVAPKHPETLYWEALLAFRQNNVLAAHEAIQKQLQLAPDNLRGLLLAGSIDYELKSYAQAEANLRKVLQRAPNDEFARRALIYTYLRNHQPGRALDTLKPVLDKIDDDAGMLALAGEVYVQNGDMSEAARHFEKAAALDPKNSLTRTALALSHFIKGETERALVELEEAAASDAGLQAHMALIAINLQRHEFDKALIAIDSLEKKLPGNPLPQNLRGAVFLAKGDLASARRNFEQALALDAAYLPAATNLARLDLAAKKPEEAKKRFEAVLVKDPKNTQAFLALAELREQSGGSPEEVATMIGKAVAANPTEAAPRLALIDHYLRSKEPKKAVASAQDALTVLPDQVEVLDALGVAQQAAGETNQAIATYNKLAQLQPTSPRPYMRMANVQADAKDNEAAAQSLRKALALEPDLVDAQRSLIVVYVDGKRVQEAIAVAREVQQQRPNESVGFIFEGDIQVSGKAWKDAAAAYRAGLKHVGTTDLAVKLHSVLGLASNASEANKFAATWLQEHPKDNLFRLYLAGAARTQQDYATAAQLYRTLVDAAPNNPTLLNNLAWVEGKINDPTALDYAERAFKLAPGNAEIMDTLGVLLVQKGDTTRGVELLQKAVALAPQAASIRLNLAHALVKAGQKEAARKELEVLAKLGDKYPEQAEVAQLMKGL